MPDQAPATDDAATFDEAGFLDWLLGMGFNDAEGFTPTQLVNMKLLYQAFGIDQAQVTRDDREPTQASLAREARRVAAIDKLCQGETIPFIMVRAAGKPVQRSLKAHAILEGWSSRQLHWAMDRHDEREPGADMVTLDAGWSPPVQ